MRIQYRILNIIIVILLAGINILYIANAAETQSASPAVTSSNQDKKQSESNTESKDDKKKQTRIENPNVYIPPNYEFISIQEYNGGKNITSQYLSSINKDNSKTNKLYINKDSTIIIMFNKENLRKLDIDPASSTSGRLSLAASINGRDIEVEKYSKIGKDYEPIGSSKMSPLIFATEIQELQTQLLYMSMNQNNTPREETIEYTIVGKLFDKFLNNIENEDDNKTTEAFFRVLTVSPITLQEYVAILKNSSYSSIIKKLETNNSRYYELNSIPTASLSVKEKEEFKTLMTQYDQLRGDLKYVNHVISELNGMINSTMLASTSSSNTLQNINKQDIKQPYNSFLAKTQKAQIRETVKQYWEEDQLKHKAYEEIYRGLENGQIVLSDVRAQPGDTVKLMLLQFPNDLNLSNKGSKDKLPSRSTIVEFHVGDFGWHMDVENTFLLIKPASSATDYKGAGGASLLFRNKIKPDDSTVDPISQFFFSQLGGSFGINVSFPSFYPAKNNIEVGVGPAIGLFNNKISIGYGVNLMAGEDYLFVGFSFVDMLQKYNNLDKKKDDKE